MTQTELLEMKLTMSSMKNSMWDEWHLRYSGGQRVKLKSRKRNYSKYRRRIFQNEKDINELWDNIMQSNVYVIGVYEREEENNDQKFSKLSDNYKTTNPRSTMKPNLKKHE